MCDSKKCSKCGEVKSLHLFSKNRSKLDGLSYQCKLCSSERFRAWYKNNSEKHCQSTKKWAQNNPEKVSLRNKRYREKNLEKCNKKSKIYRENNRDKIREANKTYQKKYIVKRRELAKIYRENITDSYACKLLKNEGFNPEIITQELIETKRTLIKIHREIHGQ